MTPQQLQAMKMALNALDGLYMPNELERVNKAITAINEALAEHAMQEVQRLGQEIEQEPVACIGTNGELMWLNKPRVIYSKPQPLYTTPPQRTEQEPCVHAKNPKGCYRVRCQLGDKCVDDEMSFRTTPPQRKPLTMDELHSIREHQELLKHLGPVWAPMLYYFCAAIEAAHDIKETT